jgi:putative phosphoribosyl transferase
LPPKFRDRREAGRVLASKLDHYRGKPDLLVLALPRGGVPVGFEIARGLGAPLDVFVVRKIGVPGHEELAMGALATGDVRVVNEEVVRQFEISVSALAAAAAQAQRELSRREHLYRRDRRAPEVSGRTVILVDDGLATGSTMRAAVRALKDQEPARLVIAVPTAAPSTCAEFEAEVDEVVCAITPDPMYSVGAWYEDFSQTSDDEVRELLEAAPAAGSGGD